MNRIDIGLRPESSLARGIEVFDVVKQLHHGVVALRIEVNVLRAELDHLEYKRN